MNKTKLLKYAQKHVIVAACSTLFIMKVEVFDD